MSQWHCFAKSTAKDSISFESRFLSFSCKFLLICDYIVEFEANLRL